MAVDSILPKPEVPFQFGLAVWSESETINSLLFYRICRGNGTSCVFGKAIGETNVTIKKAELPMQHFVEQGGVCVVETNDMNRKEELTAQEWQVVQLLRDLQYGQLVISVKNNKLVHVETRKSITLAP